MKTAAIALAAALAVTLCLSTPRGNAAAQTSPQSRYALTATSRNDVFLLDSTTGAVWGLTAPQTFCVTNARPSRVTPAENGICGPDSAVVTEMPAFQRVSVDGLYTTPYDRATSLMLARAAVVRAHAEPR